MCDIREVQTYQYYSHRMAKVGKRVEVHQDSSFRTMTWEAATVHWSCTSSTTPEEAKEFANCVLLACDLAERWTLEREGKPLERMEEGDHD